MLVNLAGVYWDLRQVHDARLVFEQLIKAVVEGRLDEKSRKCDMGSVYTFAGLAQISDGDGPQGTR